MICWKCLQKIYYEAADVCDSCGTGPAEIDAARADRFMALVVALSARDGYDPGASVVHDALFTMREIERRVEAGELFVEVRP